MLLVSDQMISLAFDWLSDHARPAAAAKAARIRAEYATKRTKARLYLEAPGNNIAEKEAWALVQEEFEAAVDREAEAVQEDEFYRAERAKVEAIVAAWQTESANIRGMGKIA